MLYKAIVIVLSIGGYDVDVMAQRLDNYLAKDLITQEQYDELRVMML